jgi:hypothetical protein
MLDQARKLTDAQGGAGGASADDGTPGSESRALVLSPVPAPPVDPETARELMRYMRNAKRLAPPTWTQRTQKRLAAKLGPHLDRYDAWRLDASRWFDRLDLAPDLAENIGSRRWLRGLGTMVGLSAVALALWPDFTPLEARPAMPDGPDVAAEMRSQMILPLALGADSGRRMGPTPAVIPLKSAPERP